MDLVLPGTIQPLEMQEVLSVTHYSPLSPPKHTHAPTPTPAPTHTAYHIDAAPPNTGYTGHLLEGAVCASDVPGVATGYKILQTFWL